MYSRANNTDDTLVREFVIKIYHDLFKINLQPTEPKKQLIDLIGIDNPNFRVEVEHGQWNGDFWDERNKKYNNKAKLDFPTINVPLRKEKHWKEEYMFFRKLINNIDSCNLNEYVRTNIDFTQFILIKPNVFRDSNKKIYTEFNANFGKEKWMSFKKEDVSTYNLINDIFVLDLNYE